MTSATLAPGLRARQDPCPANPRRACYQTGSRERLGDLTPPITHSFLGSPLVVAGAGYDECYTQADAFWIDLNL